MAALTKQQIEWRLRELFENDEGPGPWLTPNRAKDVVGTITRDDRREQLIALLVAWGHAYE